MPACGLAPGHPGAADPAGEGGEWALGEPGGALGSTGEMKGKRMNHTVSGETHESYIVSADLTDPTRISRAGGASGARSPKAGSCGGVAPGNQGPTRDPPAPLSSPRPFAPRGLSHVWGKPSSGSSWHPNEGAAHGWLPAPGVSGALVPAGVFSRLQALQARSQRRPFPGRRPFRTTRPRSRQIHYCTEKTQVLIVVYVLFFCFIPVSDPVSKDHGSTPALATPLPHRLRLLLLTLELLG